MKYFALLVVLVSCSSAYKDTSYMQSKEYKNKAVLSRSLVSDNVDLSKEEVDKILNSRIKLPKKISLAVTRLDTNFEFQRIDQRLAQFFYHKKEWGGRVKTLIPVPNVLNQYPIKIKSLRHSAVLLQADLLLVIMPNTYANWKFRLFDENKAKATTSLEIFVIDSRTGVIPFTSIITESVEIEKKDKEYDNNELIKRAKFESEKKALLETAKQIKVFLQNV